MEYVRMIWNNKHPFAVKYSTIKTRNMELVYNYLY